MASSHGGYTEPTIGALTKTGIIGFRLRYGTEFFGAFFLLLSAQSGYGGSTEASPRYCLKYADVWNNRGAGGHPVNIVRPLAVLSAIRLPAVIGPYPIKPVLLRFGAIQYPNG